MATLTRRAVALADEFITHNARVLERRRYEFLFGSGDAEAVVDALRPYRNADGGFGYALEPDCRAPGSQPVTTLAALTFLDEVGAVNGPLGNDICDYLTEISAPDGGLPFVHPNAADHPRAPWWEIPDSYTGALIPTANIAGLLHKNKVDHPWLAPATRFCWQWIDGITRTHPYEVLAVVGFLDHVPDRARAEAAAARIGELARANGVIKLDNSGTAPPGFADGEVHYPHDYASTPDSLALRWFTDAELDAGLDALIAEQDDDGSWPIRWLVWSPVITYEWRGWLTINALTLLRAYGRIET